MSRSKKQKVNILDVVPCPRSHILTHLTEEGKVVLGILRFKSKWVRKYLLPKKIAPEIKVALDVHGSEVWKLINGKNNVKMIIEALQPHFEEEVEHYSERVITYLYHLHKDKLIEFMAAPKE
ncbi:MAG: PqqD family protein [Bacteroides sp.]